MLFMVVEHFAQGRVAEIYRIAREDGRQLPDGLRYIDSWVAASLDTCFQLMECDNLASMQVDSVCGCDFPSEFGVEPQALETIAPSYLGAEAVTSRFNRYRARGGR